MESSSNSSKDFGSLGEDIAYRHLKSMGYRILHRNLHLGKAGELDIVASDGDTLVFVEVKAKTAGQPFGGFHSINYGKQKQLAKLATIYTVQHDIKQKQMRFDAVEVVVSDDSGDEPVVNHIRDAFRP